MVSKMIIFLKGASTFCSCVSQPKEANYNDRHLLILWTPLGRLAATDVRLPVHVGFVGVRI